MPAQRRGAALFDGRHDLELAEAQVRMLGLSPGWPVEAKDIRHFQGTWPHGSDLRRVQILQGTDDFAQDIGLDLGIQRGGLELLVSQQNLDHADIDLLFQQMRGETMAPMSSKT